MLARGLYSVVFWSFLGFTSIALFPVAVAIWLLTAPFDRRKVILHRFTCFWASLYSWLNPAWPVRIEGRHKIVRGEPYVMVANHLSLLDILVLFRLATHFKWVSKIENFRIPVIGWNMRMNGYVKLRRGDRESVRQMMQACERELRAGSPIMMFPEGTRSATGELREFKPGAFELALRTGSPILPIVVQGTADALPKRGLVLRGYHPIRIRVLDPLPYRDFADLSVAELSDRVRGHIAQELARKPLTPTH